MYPEQMVQCYTFKHSGTDHSGTEQVQVWYGSAAALAHIRRHTSIHTSGVPGKTKDYRNFSDIKNRGIK